MLHIDEIRATPLRIPLKQPYIWANGRRGDFEVVLVEVEASDGTVGYGESVAAPDGRSVASAILAITRRFPGRSPFDIRRLCRDAWELGFAVGGADAATGYAGQLLAGVEMALWDLIGRALDQPVHHLLGGPVRDRIRYFGFLQGETAPELAAHAAKLIDEGHDVLYMKVGRGEAIDLEHVAAVRAVIGNRRLRLDANEAWDPLTAMRMISRLAPFGPEFIEQPTPRSSLAALAQVRRASGVPIAVDQSVLTAGDVYETSIHEAADLIVLGLHETGGLLGMLDAAAVARAAGLNICLHGVFETGITTCASMQVAATIPNLDDGNQIMCQLLEQDIITDPGLIPENGELRVLHGPGLGFEIDRASVERASRAYEATAS